MNQFSERYKAFLVSDLLRVVENKNDYQAEAVEAAEYEIEQRQLTDQELIEAKNELEAERQEKQKLIEKRAEVERKVKRFGALVFDTINPNQKSDPTAERSIRLITIVFGLIALYQLFNQFQLILFMLTDSTTGWDLGMVEYFLPLILLPVATVLFWTRKKIGWILMATYLTYSTISAFGLVIITWNMEPMGVSAFDNLFPQASTTTQILTTLIFGGTLWVLNKNEVKENFKINRHTAIGTMAISGALTILFIAPFYLT